MTARELPKERVCCDASIETLRCPRNRSIVGDKKLTGARPRPEPRAAVDAASGSGSARRQEMSMRHPSLLAVSLSILLLTSCDEPAPDAKATNGLDQATAKRMADSLERLVVAMERAAVPAASPSHAALVTATPERSTPADGLHDLSSRLAALEQAVAALQSRAPMSPLTGPIASVAPIQSGTVLAILRRMQGDGPNSRQEGWRELFGATQSQVLQRLGLPSNTSLNDSHVEWTYEVDDQSLRVLFRDGVVQALYED